MKPKYFVTLIVCSTMMANRSYAQVCDYMKMRDTLAILGCDDFDSITKTDANNRLAAIDANNITKNKITYFKNMASSDFDMASLMNDSLYLKNAIYNYRRAYQLNNNDFLSLWDLCCCLTYNKHCNELEYLIPTLKTIIPRKNRKEMDTQGLIKNCNNKVWWFKN